MLRRAVEKKKKADRLSSTEAESESIQFLIIDSLIVSLLVSLCGERK